MSIKKVITTNSIETQDIMLSLWSELLFTFLPFLIVAIIELYKAGKTNILYRPEWSLASSILAGQTIVKFIGGLLKNEYRFRLGSVSLIITGLIVFLLAPSLVVLSLILISVVPATWLAITQVILFLVAIISFLMLGRVSGQISQS